ncbi:hypothetical protein [Paracidovorax anthurii]|uniref:Uncharacterized protein n=1 Tax=Paracidovorax anthurii TaxID=78229 RepID=A0A328ZEM3_9BURK|nr:hypothetical protein [Paracidovorax anthurii]RAR84740.1 hypothetical protein AX018_101092 [Paracidovorax anthurii]
MFGINHIKRAFAGSSSTTQGTTSAPSSPARGSSHRPTHAQGMPPARQAGAGEAAGQVGPPRADLRAANISTRPPLPWNVASKLYDPGVIAAERLRVNHQIIDQAPLDGNAVVIDRAEIEATLRRNMAERANDNNVPRDEVDRRLNSSPELQAEFSRLSQMVEHQGRGFPYRRAELVHIASTNLAFRAQSEAQGAPQRARAGRTPVPGSPSHPPRAEGRTSAPHSPARGSSHRPVNAHGMSAPRNAEDRRAEGRASPPRADIGANQRGRARLDWSIARQLYDPLVLIAEGRAAMTAMHSPGNSAGVRMDAEETDRQIGDRLRAQANAHAYSRQEVRQRLEANPDLKAEYEAVVQKSMRIGAGGPIMFDAFEMLHIATANLAARAEARDTSPPRRDYAPHAPARPRPSAPPLGGEGRAPHGVGNPPGLPSAPGRRPTLQRSGQIGGARQAPENAAAAPQRPREPARAPVEDPDFFNSMVMGPILGPNTGR